MTNDRPKSVNGLMQHMRNDKNISIKGSTQKRRLRNMGYFHGYKGYRFCNAPQYILPYTDFDELEAVYGFDMKLKTCIYPRIMFVETALKNYALEVLIEQTDSKRFADVYSLVLNDYKSYPVGSKNYTYAVNKRLALRNRIYSDIASNYGKNYIVGHYYDKDAPVPVWAIFELLTFGEFGNFLHCMNHSSRIVLLKKLGIDHNDNPDGRIVEQIVFLLKDLRNSVAHNNAVFDGRFRQHAVSNKVKNYLTQETGIENIVFDTIADYIILIAFVMKKCGATKTEIRRFIRDFSVICEELRASVPIQIYSRIIHTDTRNKLRRFETFI